MIYGPNTEAVQSLIDRIPALTDTEITNLASAWDAARDAAWDAAWDAARYEAWYAARYEAWYAARGAVSDAARGAARGAAWDAVRYEARGAAWDAVLATVIYDLATIDGPYTIAHRTLLMAPWVEVCGMPEELTFALDGKA